MKEFSKNRRYTMKCVAASIGIAAMTAFSATHAEAGAIKVGAPIPVTGPFSSDGQAMEKGIRLALDELNSNGGILGNQLELHIFDIGDLTPDKLQAAATNLVEKQNVEVLINGYGGMGPDIPAFCPYSLPYIHADATSNVVELRDRMKCDNIFMASDIDVNYGKNAFRQMLALDHDFPNKKLAIIHGPYDWELNTSAGAKEVAEENGWEVVVSEEVPYETKQWGGIISKLRAADPAIIFFELLDPAAVNTFIDQFRSNPAKNALLYAGYTVSVPAFSEIVQLGKAEGVLGMTLASHQSNERGLNFTAEWSAEYGENPPYSIAAQIFDMVMLWASAVEKVGSANEHDAVNEAIKAASYEGITGIFSFTDNHYVSAGDSTIPAQLLQAGSSKTRQIMIGNKKTADFITPPWMQ